MGTAKVVGFVSAATGTGSTSTLANLACVLASTGRRVLVVDWAGTPHVDEYLEPFRVAHRPSSGLRHLLVPERRTRNASGDQTPDATRFVVPDTTGYVDVVDAADPSTSAAYRDPAKPAAIIELRNQLTSLAYDDVLIDAPPVELEGSVDMLARLCDLAVICFRPRRRAILDAVDLAMRLRHSAPVRLGVLPVAVAFNEDAQPMAHRIRGTIRAAFADVVAGQDWPANAEAVEIPHRPFESFAPLVAILADEESGESQLHRGHGRLAAVVTDGAVTAPPQWSDTLRGRYRRVLGLESLGEPDRILIAYAGHDRPWADWVRSRLERCGAQVRSFTDGAEWLDPTRSPGIVLVSSRHMDESPLLDEVNRLTTDRSPAVVCLDVEGRDWVDAVGLPIIVSPGSENVALARLVEFFGLIDLPGLDPDRSRPPGDYPELMSLPPRHPTFVGRDDEIQQLRDRLVDTPDGAATVVLSGLPGIGKSELALEYAYRFGNSYDLVWWVPSGDEQSLLLSLARLANRLEVPGSPGYGSTSALDRLSLRAGHRRFLLIYDNADETVDLEDRLPVDHRGHVIITTRQTEETGLELVTMSARDSMRLLNAKADGLAEDDARAVASAAEHLPVALELAGSWLGEKTAALRHGGSTVADAAAEAASTFLAELAEGGGPREPRMSPAPAPMDVVARVVAVVCEAMTGFVPSKVALLVARLCAFLSPDWISLDLVRSAAFCDRLKGLGGPATDLLKLDAFELDHALRTGAKYGLFRLTWGEQSSLRMHRIVQESLKRSVTSGEAGRWQRETLAALAAYAPTEVEDQATYYASRFTELIRHVYPSGAIESRDDAVRRWLVNQTRFLYVQGSVGVRRAAVAPVQKLLAGWKDTYGLDDPLVWRLSGCLANLHRALGEPHQAFQLTTEALGHQRRVLGLDHPQVLFTARGRAADLRSLGNFREALEEDRATWDGLRQAFGADHPQTTSAAHNLASSLFAAGEVPAALQIACANYVRRRRLLDERHPMVWSSLVQIGIYQRELGDYDTAVASLRQAASRLRDADTDQLPLELVARRHLAITQRCMGEAAAASERTGRVLTDMREQLGPGHPNTLACVLSLAAAHRAAGAQPELAVELAHTALDGLQTSVGLVPAHPHIALCRLGLGLALCAAGQAGSGHTEAALRSLTEQLGGVHPWTLAAAVSHARVVAACGRPSEQADSSTRLAQAYQDCLEYLGAKHPYTLIADHNLALARGASDARVDDSWREIDVDIPET
jgi:Mrp family chromosome partitioning ATPase/tetratricopeptide (TPR) repeat protein